MSDHPISDQQTSAAQEPAEDTAAGAARQFAALGLGADTLRAIEDLGYGAPTPIQQQTIGPMLAGRDIIAQAPTGTGKTAAYGLPIIERLDIGDLTTQALILSPTRELAIQVAEAIHNLGKYREVVTLPIYGGAPYERQFRALARGVQVVIGTPGRLLDHLRRKTLDLSHVRTVILDEADEMLDMGFIEDIETILQELPAERQGGLFSATIPPRVARLAESYLHDPFRVSVAAKEAVAPKVRQVYYEVSWPEKAEALARILDYEQPDSAIVFVRTRRDADEVAERLNGLGYLAQPIHGDINQSMRERTLSRFREGRTQLLVATDVAARGLDIPEVSHVINYDLPEDADAYVHRIGRTGRAGRTGEAITLVTPRERRALTMIERLIHRRLQQLRLPTEADVASRRRAAFRDELLSILDAGQLDPYLGIVEDLAETRDPAELAAAAFKLAVLAREASPTRIARHDGAPTPKRPAAHALPGAPGIAASPPMPPSVSEPIERSRPTRAPQPEHAEHARRAPEGEREGERDMAGQRAGASAVGAAGGRRAGAEHRESRDRHDQHDVDGAGHALEPGMVRLFLRIGRHDKVRPADFVGAIANEAHLPGDAVGDIDIYDTFSFIEVPEPVADRILRALNRTTIRGRDPQATIARPIEDGARRDTGLRPVRYSRDTRPPLAPRRPTLPPRRGAGRFTADRPPLRRKPTTRRERERRP